jgi:hypothetical protein
MLLAKESWLPSMPTNLNGMFLVPTLELSDSLHEKSGKQFRVNDLEEERVCSADARLIVHHPVLQQTAWGPGTETNYSCSSSLRERE